MLFLKRSLTTFGLFVILFGVLFFGAMVVCGTVTGVLLAAQDQDTGGGFGRGYELGVHAGAEFRQQYLVTVVWIALGAAAVGSVGLSFSGVFPWCRRDPLPPPLPRALS